jgi:dienelactone hydrolase
VGLSFVLSAAIAAAAEPAKPLSAPAEVKAEFLKLLDRPRIAPDPQTRKTASIDPGLQAEYLSMATEKKADGAIERTPILLVRPAKLEKRLPAVIVRHGTGGTKESLHAYLVELAKRGIIGVAIDARYHGERSGGEIGSKAYVAAIVRAWKTPAGQPQEHPFYFDTCWDIWRTIDYLQARPDVDGERIGMIGFSMGGIETWLAASVDERVKVAVCAIAVQSLQWSLENGAWQGRARTIYDAHLAAAKDLGEPMVNARVCRELWNKIVPGILDRFDCPSLIRLFAGRPLLIVNGELDPNCPLGGAKIAFGAAEKAYNEASAPEKLKIMVAPQTAHKVTDEQLREATNWLEKWLKS